MREVKMIGKTQLGKYTDARGILLWASSKLLDFDFKYLTIGSIEPNCKRGGHYHKVTPEKLMCISGKLDCVIGDESITIEEGEIVDIPVNKTHTFINNYTKVAYFIEFKGLDFDENKKDVYTEKFDN
jgi:mannose-6-phosphate isomerase-like protein (cupin superfamily)